MPGKGGVWCRDTGPQGKLTVWLPTSAPSVFRQVLDCPALRKTLIPPAPSKEEGPWASIRLHLASALALSWCLSSVPSGRASIPNLTSQGFLLSHFLRSPKLQFCFPPVNLLRYKPFPKANAALEAVSAAPSETQAHPGDSLTYCGDQSPRGLLWLRQGSATGTTLRLLFLLAPPLSFHS